MTIKKLYRIIIYFITVTCIYSQNVDISGKIIGRDGEPVVGADILLENKNMSTTTDQDGNYLITGTSAIINTLAFNSLYNVSMKGNQITFTINEPNNVIFSIYNLHGRIISNLHRGHLNKGKHNFVLPLDNLSNQVYLAHIKIGANVRTHRIIPIANSFVLSGKSIENDNSIALNKKYPADDNLVVSCNGYEAKTVNVTEYVAIIDIVLEFDWSDYVPPEITYENKYSSFSEFTDRFPNIEDTAKAIAYGVCRKLYRKWDESLKLEEIKFILDDDPNTIGWKSGKPPKITICIGGPYLQNYMDNDVEKMADEVKGIMWHEYTHGYQYDDSPNSGGEIGGVVEGIADAVRYFAGYIPISMRRPGGSWTYAYKTSAFFIAWIQEEYNGGDPEFLYKFNQQLANDDGKEFSWQTAIQEILGEDVSDVWDKYQDDISIKE